MFAITLELWSDPANDGERSCCSADAVRVARSVAHAQGIPHLTVDLREEFRAGVVEPFLEGYAAGVTPNPCVRCNGRVRIEPMIAIAERLGAAGLATGHYARLADDGSGALLTAASDPGKDQTYMLAGLPTEALRRLRFPLGDLDKPQVRELAREAGLPVADKAESQDLCFLAGEGKAGFLARHGGLPDREGEIADADGNVIGTHPGHHRFTVGQRRGIGLASPVPLYVLSTDAASNRVVVGPGGAAGDLPRGDPRRDPAPARRAGRLGPAPLPLARRSPAGSARPPRTGPTSCRRAATSASSWSWKRPARAAAPGQTAVLFDGDLVVGHGTIA